MERYLASYKEGDYLAFNEATLKHLFKVLRHSEDDEIEVIYDGHLYLCALVKDKALIKKELPDDSELPSYLTLAFSLLKGDKNELVLQKGTELGVTSFLPFISSRSLVKLDCKDRVKKLERYQAIVKGAVEQCHRLKEPKVLDIIDFKDVVKSDYQYKFIAYEDEKDKALNFLDALKDLKKDENVLILIGPEGGFSKEEVEESKAQGFTSVSLGKRILRAETASIYAASLFSYGAEKL